MVSFRWPPKARVVRGQYLLCVGPREQSERCFLGENWSKHQKLLTQSKRKKSKLGTSQRDMEVSRRRGWSWSRWWAWPGLASWANECKSNLVCDALTVAKILITILRMLFQGQVCFKIQICLDPGCREGLRIRRNLSSFPLNFREWAARVWMVRNLFIKVSGSVEFPSLGKTGSTSLWQAFQKAQDFPSWSMQISLGDS